MPHNNLILLKKGCPSAFAEIHAKHNRHIFWLGKQMIKDDFVIDTLVQDTFLKLWIQRDTIESPKHLFFFLRLVMKRECISYYTKPRNKFFRTVHSLDSYENYQDYMAGYDPIKDMERRAAQDKEQQDFERIKKIVPLLNTERRHLIELCLKYGFQYRAISEVMGTSITETSNKVKKTIKEIKSIIDPMGTLESKQRPTIKVHGVMTAEQAEILKLRYEEKCSFAAIATTLKRSQKEVRREFMVVYKLLQAKHQQQQKA